MSYEICLEPVVHIRLTYNEVNMIYSALLRGSTLKRVPHEGIRRQFNNILEDMVTKKKEEDK